MANIIKISASTNKNSRRDLQGPLLVLNYSAVELLASSSRARSPLVNLSSPAPEERKSTREVCGSSNQLQSFSQYSRIHQNTELNPTLFWVAL